MKTAQPQAHAHHYVPRWYQRRFLAPGQSTYFYLDLRPEMVERDGIVHQRRALLRWGPNRCFYKDDLYTLRFGQKTSDAMERVFFGSVDTHGRMSVETFGDYRGMNDSVNSAFQYLIGYMGAQRFRTPRGLDEIREMAATEKDDLNAPLIALRNVFQAYGTMWSEGIWEFVRARQSPTKFIVSDNPVTFFCKVMFASEWTYPNEPSLKQIGTRTLFPLGPDCCLIITHLQLARNPWSTPTELRENARFYDRTMVDLTQIQFGRELEEDEVLRINYILKRRATRYIAAANEEWLYPEKRVSTTEWRNLDDDWFLLPHLWKVPFTSEIVTGGDDWAWAMDEYGRHPGHIHYRNRRMRERDWITTDAGKKEWARRRAGKPLAQVDPFRHGDVADSLMEKFLRGELD